MTIIQILPTDSWWSNSYQNQFNFGVVTKLDTRRMSTKNWRDIGWYSSNVIYKGPA